MEIKPHKNLYTKQWLEMCIVSIFIVIFGIILQLLIPLKEGVTATQTANILWPIIVGIILLLWIISVPFIILWIKNLSYFIEDDRVIIYKGILSKTQQNIPYRAVTDFMLHRSLFDRYLNIGSILIQTAGQGQKNVTGYEGKLTGLINWEDIYIKLRSKLKNISTPSAPTTVTKDVETTSMNDKLTQIIEELQAIRRSLKRK